MKDADAIVVGAGPGGASAALHLARRGRRVLLLERHRFPRDKACGDGLTRFTTRLLADMNILDHLETGHPARGVRVSMRGRGNRDFRYPDHLAEPNCGTVVPRLILDELICESAVAAGAELREETRASRLLYDDGVVVGVEVSVGEETMRLHAPVVIAADGAASELAYQAGLVATPKDRLGYAVRGYYSGIDGLTDLLEIYMPLLDPTDRYLLPSYGWVFPTGPGTANIGVGLVHRERGANIRNLFTRFLNTLRKDPRFRNVELCGTWRGAPLRFDFLPERCMAPGLLLAGDAAGMISPFTGEGIGYALESGRLAAETVAEALDAEAGGSLDLSAYPTALGRQFTGYFEAGRQSARRYQLIWHVLESTFENDRPLFDISRRAALFPEGVGESFAGEVLDDVSSFLGHGGVEETTDKNTAALLRTDLLSIGEVLIETVRYDWPFLAQVVTADQMVPGIPFRPALLLLLAGRLTRPRRPSLVTVGAAIELGYLAALAQTSVGEDERFGRRTKSDAPGSRPANWGNMFALMVGDFLFSKANAMSAGVAPEVSREIAASLSTACEGYVLALRNAHNTDMTLEEHLATLQRKTATLFELPCRLGASLSGATDRVVGALSAYGRHLGLAHQLIDDVLAVSGQATQLGRAVGSDLREGVYSLPIVHVLQSEWKEAMKEQLGQLREGCENTDVIYSMAYEQGGVAASLTMACSQAQQARDSLECVPHGHARASLLALVDYVLGRGETISR